MPSLHSVAMAAAITVGAAALWPASRACAQTSSAAPSATAALQRTEITGSHIPRLAAQGPLPVAVITRAEVERLGVASTAELLRSLTYMSSFNDELQSSAPSLIGSAAANFRGLAGNQTVVLINGRRVANHGFDGGFVNLNTLPLAAVQRVEVLKDGASAIYGADAIGGVINFITRRQFQGLRLDASVGQSSRGDAEETLASLTAGVGNPQDAHYHLLANLSYLRRDPLMNTDRERTRTLDFRRFGGSNQLSTSSPTGNFVDPATGRQAPFTPCPSAELLVSPSPLTPGVAGSASCVYDAAPDRTTVFGTERISALLIGRYVFTEQLQARFEGLVARSESSVSAAAAPGNFVLPVGHPANAYPSALTVRGRPVQAGPRTTDNTADASRLLLGLQGQHRAWDWSLDLARAWSRAVNLDHGYLLTDRLNAAVASRSFNPFSTSNDQAVVDAITSTDTRSGRTSVNFVDGRAWTDLFTLPAGTAALALGLSASDEDIADIPGPNLQAGNVFGSVRQSPVMAQRHSAAALAELNAPISAEVEAQLALRYDRYSGNVAATSPKLALRWQPAKEVLLRGSYSQGFRMPTLRELFGGPNASADSVQDFAGCAASGVSAASCPRLQYERQSGGNGLLRPERSRGTYVGLVLEPAPGTHLEADFFNIRKFDEVGLVQSQFVIDSVPYVRGATTTLNGNPAFFVTRNAAGTITSIGTGLDNLGERLVRGADVLARQQLATPMGQLTLEGSGTYYSRYAYADLPGNPLLSRMALLNQPRWRSQVRAGLTREDWQAWLSWNGRASMFDKQAATAATPVTASTVVVGNFDTVDLAWIYTGFKGFKLGLHVFNLMDREPPFSNNDARTLGFSQMDDLRGRYFKLSTSIGF